MDGLTDNLYSIFTWIYTRIPHHPAFLIVFVGFTVLKIYCTLCFIVEHIKIRNHSSKMILINGYEQKSHARLLAIKCVKEGMNVFVACRNQEALKFLESSAINGSGSIDAFVMDPTKDASVLELKQKIEDKLIAKEKELFAIVNCFGTLNVGYDDWLSLNDYERSMQENFFSFIRVIHAFKPMLKASKGRIINFSTVYGKFAIPGLGPTCLSSCCIEMFSDILRREMSPFGVKTIVVQGGILFRSTKVSTAFQSIWTKLSEKMKTLYGGEAFQQKALHRIKSKEKSIFHCPFDSWTTSSLYNAITSAFPRRRYVIGFANVLFYTPLSCLPAVFQDLYLRIYLFLSWFPRVEQIDFTKKKSNIYELE